MRKTNRLPHALLLAGTAFSLSGCIAAAAIPIIAGAGGIVRSGVTNDDEGGDSRADGRVELRPAPTPTPAPTIAAAPEPAPAPVPVLLPEPAPELAAVAPPEPMPPAAAPEPVAGPAFTTLEPPLPEPDPQAAPQPEPAPRALATFDPPADPPPASNRSEPVIVMTLADMPRAAAPTPAPVPAPEPAPEPEPLAASLAATEPPVAQPDPAPEPEPVELAVAETAAAIPEAAEPAPAPAAEALDTAFADFGAPEPEPAPMPEPAPVELAASPEPLTPTPALPPEPEPEPVELAVAELPAVPPGETPVAMPQPAPAPAPARQQAELAAVEPPVSPAMLAPAEAIDSGQSLVGYAALRSYALRTLGGGLPLPSAMLADPTSLQPVRRECMGNSPTLVIDLDPAGGLVPLSGPLGINNTLARVLAELRARDVNVAWITDRTPLDARAVRDRLVASGLDPDSRDSIYVERYPGETKQARRESIGQTSCIIAVAGDERADFDDLYNYLIDYSNARALEPMLGSGWFIIENPVGE